MRAQATEETVFAAADALLAAGHEPSSLNVREQVGGSLSTVQRHLRTWEARQREAQELIVPEAIQQSMVRLGREVWRTAHAETQTAIALAQQGAQIAVAAAEGARDQAYAVIVQLEQEAEARATQLDAAQAEAQALRAALADARAVAQAETARATELERHLAGVQAELKQARATSAAQLAETMAAIQQQLAAQAAQLAHLAPPKDVSR